MTNRQDMRIYMFDEEGYEYEVDMELLDEVGYLTGVYTEGPKIGEEFILDSDQQFDAEMQWRNEQEEDELYA